MTCTFLHTVYVPCDTKLCDFQRWSFRGHNLMFYVLASKPASPPKCPVFGSRTALFFDLVKICQGHEHCWSTPENLRIFERRSFVFMEIAGILRKICDFLSQEHFLRELFRLMSLVLWHREGQSSEGVSLASDFFCVLDSTSGGFIAKIEA